MASKCRICNKSVYIMDPQINVDGYIFHKTCAKCNECKCQITLSNFTKTENPDKSITLLCKSHYLKMVQIKGTQNGFAKVEENKQTISSPGSTHYESAQSEQDSKGVRGRVLIPSLSLSPPKDSLRQSQSQKQTSLIEPIPLPASRIAFGQASISGASLTRQFLPRNSKEEKQGDIGPKVRKLSPIRLTVSRVPSIVEPNAVDGRSLDTTSSEYDHGVIQHSKNIASSNNVENVPLNISSDDNSSSKTSVRQQAINSLQLQTRILSKSPVAHGEPIPSIVKSSVPPGGKKFLKSTSAAPSSWILHRNRSSDDADESVVTPTALFHHRSVRLPAVEKNLTSSTDSKDEKEVKTENIITGGIEKSHHFPILSDKQDFVIDKIISSEPETTEILLEPLKKFSQAPRKPKFELNPNSDLIPMPVAKTETEKDKKIFDSGTDSVCTESSGDRVRGLTSPPPYTRQSSISSISSFTIGTLDPSYSYSSDAGENASLATEEAVAHQGGPQGVPQDGPQGGPTVSPRGAWRSVADFPGSGSGGGGSGGGGSGGGGHRYERYRSESASSSTVEGSSTSYNSTAILLGSDVNFDFDTLTDGLIITDAVPSSSKSDPSAVSQTHSSNSRHSSNNPRGDANAKPTPSSARKGSRFGVVAAASESICKDSSLSPESPESPDNEEGDIEDHLAQAKMRERLLRQGHGQDRDMEREREREIDGGLSSEEAAFYDDLDDLFSCQDALSQLWQSQQCSGAAAGAVGPVSVEGCESMDAVAWGKDMFDADMRQQSECGRPAAGLEEVYAVAERALPEFERVLISLAAAAGLPRTSVRIMPLKSRMRAADKAEQEYADRTGPAVGWLFDVVRGAIVCETEEGVCRLLGYLLREGRWKHQTRWQVTRAKNRFHSTWPCPSGYRDALVHIQLKLDPAAFTAAVPAGVPSSSESSERGCSSSSVVGSIFGHFVSKSKSQSKPQSHSTDRGSGGDFKGSAATARLEEEGEVKAEEEEEEAEEGGQSKRLIHHTCELQIQLRPLQDLAQSLDSWRWYDRYRPFFRGGMDTVRHRVMLFEALRCSVTPHEVDAMLRAASSAQQLGSALAIENTSEQSQQSHQSDQSDQSHFLNDGVSRAESSSAVGRLSASVEAEATGGALLARASPMATAVTGVEVEATGGALLTRAAPVATAVTVGGPEPGGHNHAFARRRLRLRRQHEQLVRLVDRLIAEGDDGHMEDLVELLLMIRGDSAVEMAVKGKKALAAVREAALGSHHSATLAAKDDLVSMMLWKLRQDMKGVRGVLDSAFDD